MYVHYRLLTVNLFYVLLCFGLLSLKSVAFAQVYKSYDADGNVVFSDQPTKRSKEVEISRPNLSDSFQAPPPSPTITPIETIPEAQPEPEPVTPPMANGDSADTNNDGRVSKREKETQRKERRKKEREQAQAAEGYNEWY